MPPETEKPKDIRSATDPAPQPTPVESAEERKVRETEIRKAAMAEERTRSAAIHAECEKVGLERSFAEGLVDTGETLDAVRSQIIDQVAETRAGDETPSRIDVGQEAHGKRASVVEAALLHRYNPIGVNLPDGAREVRGMSLVEMGEFSQETRGGNRPTGMSHTERAQTLLNVSLRGGMHSSSDFPLILANVAEKVLLRAYRESGRTFDPLVRLRGVSDFKPVTVVRLGEAPKLKRVLPGAEYEHGTVGESGESYAVLKYGRLFGIDWETLINDDLDALTRMPQMFGRQASNLESDLFWEIFTANAAMGDGDPLFHANHGNVGSGVIGLTGLDAGMVAMGTQKGLDGETHLNIMPRHLIVPTALSTKAKQEVVLTTAPTETGKTNPFQGDLNVIVEPRLHTASQTEWYLSADPADSDTIERAYLRDHAEPFFERANGFERDGSQIKIRHVVAFRAIEHRGLYKSTGV